MSTLLPLEQEAQHNEKPASAKRLLTALSQHDSEGSDRPPDDRQSLVSGTSLPSMLPNVGHTGIIFIAGEKGPAAVHRIVGASRYMQPTGRRSTVILSLAIAPPADGELPASHGDKKIGMDAPECLW